MKTKQQFLEEKHDEILKAIVSINAEVKFLNKKDPEKEIMVGYGQKKTIKEQLEEYKETLKDHEDRLKIVKEELKVETKTKK